MTPAPAPDLAELVDLVLSCCRELNAGWQVPALDGLVADSPLYGARGALDSLQLVMLVSELEQQVRDRYGVDVLLVDEYAMSRLRSPFRRVQSLAEHVGEKLAVAQGRLPVSPAAE